MIAACPKCGARYRIEREKLRPEGVRLRCSKCEAVFKVRPPERPAAAAPAAAPEPAATEGRPGEAGAQAPSTAPAAPAAASQPAAAPEPAAAPPAAEGPLLLVAMPDVELAKRTGEALAARGLRVMLVGDGVEAMLQIQRQLPAAVLLSAQLPRMYGFQVCEIVKRNESLKHIRVVLAGAIHHRDRYRRPPGELYGADAYLEEPDLPDALPPLLERVGIALGDAPAPPPVSAPAEPTPPAAAPAPAPPAPEAAPAAPTPAAPAAPAPAARGPERRGDGLDDERAKAERLARIIVSDIVLYNEEKFAQAVRDGRVAEAMEADLAEGRGLFRDRIDERVRAEKDFLQEELLRVARARGMA